MKNLFTIIALASLLVFGLFGCDNRHRTTTADQKETRRTEQLRKEAEKQVGMPEITNFQELRFAKMIAELRDQEVVTYTYTVNMQGELSFVCQSVGYGLPYSTQITNPQRAAIVDKYNNRRSMEYREVVAIPQPEPNGLFMPDGLDATWILCLDEGTKEVKPVYSEPKLLVSPFRLNSKASYRLNASSSSNNTHKVDTAVVNESEQ